MTTLATRYPASPLEPTAEQLANRVRDAGGAGNGGMTPATDNAGNKVVVGDPSLNPQFNYAPGTPGAPAASAESPLDKASREYYEGLSKTTNPDAIRENVRKQMQGTIDATNTLYDELRNTQVNENTAQYGRVRGININAGLAGSDFGAANTNNAEEKGNAALAAIAKQRANAISQVLGNIDARAESEIKNETETAQKNSVEYINYLKGKADTSIADLKTIASSGVPLENLPQDKYDALLKQSGLDKFAFEQVYNNARPAKAKIDFTYKTVGNQVVGYGVDPLTGQMKTVETQLPFDTTEFNANPEVLSDGTLIFTPKTIDPSKPIEGQLKIYKTGVSKFAPKTPTIPAGSKPVISGNLTISQDEISQGVQILDASKDEAGFVDPTLYKKMYETWVGGGGKGQDFLKQYPVKQYVNPANDWLPTYLRPTPPSKPKTAPISASISKAPWE